MHVVAEWWGKPSPACNRHKIFLAVFRHPFERGRSFSPPQRPLGVWSQRTRCGVLCVLRAMPHEAKIPIRSGVYSHVIRYSVYPALPSFSLWKTPQNQCYNLSLSSKPKNGTTLKPKSDTAPKPKNGAAIKPKMIGSGYGDTTGETCKLVGGSEAASGQIRHDRAFRRAQPYPF